MAQDPESELEALVRRLAAAPDYILEFDRDGIISYMNRPAPGHTLDDMIGSDVRRWMEPEHHAQFEATVAEVFAGAQLSSYESVGAVTKRYYQHRVSPVVFDGEVKRAILITHDITDLRQAQERLKQLESMHRAMNEASFEGVALHVDAHILEVNRAFAETFRGQREDIVGTDGLSLIAEESLPLVREMLQTASEEPYEVVAVRLDGSRFPMEIRGRNIEYLGKAARITAVRDLSARKRQEQEQARREQRVQHAQKLETLGVLAGGVAHDFNNLLAAILSNATLALGVENLDPRARDRLDEISRATRRASELTNQLLVYAGRGKHKTAPVDLNAFVNETTPLLRVSLSKKAELRYALADTLPSIEADPGQLGQVLINLVTNASDALDQEPGTIEVSTGIADLDPSAPRGRVFYGDPRAGRYVTLGVRDTGHGMDRETIQRIFDPFYTTKFAGRGLGLASVLGIVRAHGGAVEVESERGRGTSFRVYFPVASETGRQQPTRPEANPRGKLRATILLAEDEAALARATRDILELDGHRVLLAFDGQEALEVFAAHSDEVDLAVLDLTMPRKGGHEVAAALQQARPGLPVLLVSGFADVADWASPPGGGTPVLQKPYEVSELLEVVQSALSGRVRRSEPPG